MSLVIVKKADIMIACSKKLIRMAKMRKEIFLEQVEILMYPNFFGKKRTFDQAVKKELSKLNEFHYMLPPWFISYNGIESRCNKLINSCRITPGEILFLSIEDASFIYTSLKK